MAATGAPALSIAVLPFTNLTGEANDEYFADGLAEELLNVLAKINGLRVAARTSAFSFKNKSATVVEIGRLLNVATVLEGSVRRSDNRMRISVQLVKVEDGFHLWSETYDRTLDDIFAVQDDIAQIVLAELRAKLLKQTSGRIELRSVEAEVAVAAKGRSNDPEAHRLYLRARFLLNRHASADIAKSVEYLREALLIDADYAQAWAALSHALVTADDMGIKPIGTRGAEALKAAQRALELDPALVDGHVAMCRYQVLCTWDLHGAADSVRRALAIALDDVGALREAALIHYMIGRPEESLRFAERATALDPLNSICVWYVSSSSLVLGRMNEAEVTMRKALELSPEAPSLRARLALFLDLVGRHDEAMAEVNREQTDWGRFFALGILHFRHGNLAESDRALNDLIKGYGATASYQIAMNYCVRGDADRAFQWLEYGYTERDIGLLFLKTGWMQKFGWLTPPIETDPRWPAFLRKMRFDD